MSQPPPQATPAPRPLLRSNPFLLAPSLPLVPRILVAGPGGGDIYNAPDFWAFTESCLVRGAGSADAFNFSGEVQGANAYSNSVRFFLATAASAARGGGGLRGWSAVEWRRVE